MKSKLFIAIFMVMMCVLLAFSLTACGDDGSGETTTTLPKGDPGQNGATWLIGTTAPAADAGRDGDMYLNTATFDLYTKVGGVWVDQGNIGGTEGQPGEPADPDKMAFIVFDTDSDSCVCDPIMIEKGRTIAELPTPTKEFLVFDGWYHGSGFFAEKVTSETVIEQSMALVARYKADLSFATADDDINAGETEYLDGYYGGYVYRSDISVTSITFEGQKYTVDQAVAAGLIPEDGIYISTDGSYGYDYGYDYDVTEIYTEVDFLRAGEYVLTYEVDGDSGLCTADVYYDVLPPLFENVIRVNEFRFNAYPNTSYKPGDTVTLYDPAARPEVLFDVWVYAPVDSYFTATLNGTELTCTPTYKSDGVWALEIDGGSFDEAVTTNELIVTATSYSHGSRTDKLTVVLAQQPDTPRLISNSYDLTLPRSNTFVQFVSFYGSPAGGYTTTFELKDAADQLVSGGYYAPVVSQSNSGTYNSFKLDMGTASSLKYGKYTLYTKVTDVDNSAEVLSLSATFYVIPYDWNLAPDNTESLYLNIPATVEYTLGVAAQGLTLGGVELVAGQAVSIPCDYATVTATYAVEGTTTTLSINYTGTVPTHNGDDFTLFKCVVDMGEYSFETYFAPFDVMDSSYDLMMYKNVIRSYIYTFETYFATEIVTPDHPAKLAYDVIMAADTDDMDILEMQQFMNSTAQQMEGFYEYLNTTLPTTVNSAELLQAARETALAECEFSEAFIQMISGIGMSGMGPNLFSGDIEYSLSGRYYDLMMIGMAEAQYLLNGGKMLADLLYLEIDYALEYESQGVPGNILEMGIAVRDAKLAADEAIAAGAANAAELSAKYVRMLESVMTVFMQII